MLLSPPSPAKFRKHADKNNKMVPCGSVGKDLQDLAKERTILSDPAEFSRRRTIRLVRQPQQTCWGFTLQTYGIRHKTTGEVEVMTYVDYVQLRGAAYVAGMRKGDMVLSVNGETVEGLNHQQLVSKIQQCTDVLRLVVLFEDCCRRVELYERFIRLQRILTKKKEELLRLNHQEQQLCSGSQRRHHATTQSLSMNNAGESNGLDRHSTPSQIIHPGQISTASSEILDKNNSSGSSAIFTAATPSQTTHPGQFSGTPGVNDNASVSASDFTVSFKKQSHSFSVDEGRKVAAVEEQEEEEVKSHQYSATSIRILVEEAAEAENEGEKRKGEEEDENEEETKEEGNKKKTLLRTTFTHGCTNKYRDVDDDDDAGEKEKDYDDDDESSESDSSSDSSSNSSSEAEPPPECRMRSNSTILNEMRMRLLFSDILRQDNVHTNPLEEEEDEEDDEEGEVDEEEEEDEDDDEGSGERESPVISDSEIVIKAVGCGHGDKGGKGGCEKKEEERGEEREKETEEEKEKKEEERGKPVRFCMGVLVNDMEQVTRL